jgi:phosphatidylserine/phosphatidylglycerophosphate/cardiolipin synthase-like enzyme
MFLSLLLVAASIPSTQAIEPLPIQVYFSPRGGCTEAIVKQIASATRTVHVQAYSFTSAPIAAALVAAHKRGVRVAVILDKSQRGERYSSATFLLNSGITPLIDSRHAIAHNKVILIDGRIVITGSFNFSKAAEESNAENLLVIPDPDLAAKYLANWQAHQNHSEPYSGLPATRKQ